MNRTALLMMSTLALLGCRDARPPAPTAAENRQLDDTAAMLDNLASDEAAPAANSAAR